MKRIAVLSMMMALLGADHAQARPASVTNHNAYFLTGRVLKENFATWRWRDGGWIVCDRRGRLNRYTMACRVHWAKGKRCWLGRSRVTGRDDGRFNTRIRTRRYRCVGWGN